MNADHVVRFLRQLRYARRRGRPIAISWVAIQSGCGRTSLYNAIVSGHISEGLADRIGRAFQNVQFGADLATLSYDGGPDPRGGRRPVRRRDDRRLRAVRALRGTAGANCISGPARREKGERTFARPAWRRLTDWATRRCLPERTNTGGHRTGAEKSSYNPHRRR